MNAIGIELELHCTSRAQTPPELQGEWLQGLKPQRRPLISKGSIGCLSEEHSDIIGGSAETL